MHHWQSLIKLDHQSRVPFYHQIVQNFRGLIESNQLGAGELIPPEWDLAQLYGVSRMTVRRALDELVRAGLITRRHGVGTFVARLSEAQILPSELSFTKNMQQIGRKPSSRVVSLKVVPAAKEVAETLYLKADAPVFQVVRVRKADGEPLMLETTYVSQERFPGLASADLSQGSLYNFLAVHYQVNIVALDQAMEPTLLTDREAGLLEVGKGSPAILSEMVSFDANGTPVEYTWSVTCGGRGRFYFHFREGDIGKRRFTQSMLSHISRE